ncbi:U2 snRNP component prp10, partial [Tilletia horrida]
LKDRKILCLLLTFELLDLLKALKRAIRRAAVNSFGYIAKAFGPQDVVQVLLNHLHMQERQCSVYAQLSPLPSHVRSSRRFRTPCQNTARYRTPELNVRRARLYAQVSKKRRWDVVDPAAGAVCQTHGRGLVAGCERAIAIGHAFCCWWMARWWSSSSSSSSLLDLILDVELTTVTITADLKIKITRPRMAPRSNSSSQASSSASTSAVLA